MKTKTLKQNEIRRVWHLLDAAGKVLGRLSVGATTLLTGKEKVSYSPETDGGDYVVIVNAEKILLTGKKEQRKFYYRYSGYPGGLRKTLMKDLRTNHPEELVRKAIAGMLPNNRLKARRLGRLFIYKGSNHPHAVQLGVKHD